MALLLIAVLVLATLCLALLLPRGGSAAVREQRLSAAIDRLLPQTQCGACGYPGCEPYARAIARGAASIDLCPPGGEQTIKFLAQMLGRNYRPLAPHVATDNVARVALIDEATCIGCVKCIHACPVDAIVGAPKQMHSVMPKPCTGCGLCVDPCPVDCISLVPAGTRVKQWVWPKPSRPFELQP
jgi:electron transport complex protein RnfB